MSWNVLLQPEGFTAAKQKTVMIGSDRTRFNANNFELAAVLHRFPSRIVTSAYEDDLPSLLSRLYFIEFLVYKDGGEPESRFYNRHQAALLEEVRNGGSFREIPAAVPLPDGGTARIFQNVSLQGSLRSSAFIPSGADG